MVEPDEPIDDLDEEEAECEAQFTAAEEWMTALIDHCKARSADHLAGVGDILTAVGREWRTLADQIDIYQLMIVIRVLVGITLSREDESDEEQFNQEHFFLHLLEDFIAVSVNAGMDWSPELIEDIKDLFSDAGLQWSILDTPAPKPDERADQ
jgi:hypothetical protein